MSERSVAARDHLFIATPICETVVTQRAWIHPVLVLSRRLVFGDCKGGAP